MVEDGGDLCCRIFLLCFLAVPCPPFAVMCHRGCDNNVWINLLFTTLLWFPGIFHAIYVICTKPPADAGNRVNVTVVNNNSANANTRY